MIIQTKIDNCKLNTSYTEQSSCLNELKASTASEGTLVLGFGIMASIVVVGSMMYIHSKVKDKK